MPKIPIYDQRVTPSASGFSPNMRGSQVGAGLAEIGRGVAALGGALDRGEEVDFQLEQQGIQLERQRVETEGRIWASKSTSQADLDMAGFLSEAQKAAPPGASGFTPSFLKQFDDYAEKAVANAPSKFAKQLMQAHMNQSREAYGKAALTFEAQEFARFQGQQVDDGVQISASLVSANPAWFEREMGKWNATISGVPIQEAAKAKMREVAKNTLVTAAVKGWIDANPTIVFESKMPNGDTVRASYTPADMIRSALKEGAGEPYMTVKWDGKEVVKVPIGMLDYKQQQQMLTYAEQRAESIRQDTSVALRYETQNLESMAALGVAPTGQPRTEAEFMASFKNPEVAKHEYARYMAARGAASSTATLKGRSTADLMALIQAKPAASDPNFAVNAAAQNVQAQAAASIIKARVEDPVAYALTAGDFGMKPLDMSKQAEFSQELSRRAAALPVMAEKYGKADMLSKDEARVLGQQLGALPADQKVEKLTAIRKSVGDDMVYGALLNSIRPDSPVTALVGNIAAAGSPENARLIARGEDLLNPTKAGKAGDGKSSFPLPQEALLRQAWVDAVGDAYRGFPEAEATGYQAFKAFYAASAAQKGLNDPKASPDDRIVRDAVAASTGGVMRWKTDWFGNDTPSANIVLPYGMPADVFRDRVSAEWLRVRDAAGYSKTSVGDIGLYNTGANGEYMVMSGASWLPGKDGKPVLLRILPGATPPSPEPSGQVRHGPREVSGKVGGVN